MTESQFCKLYTQHFGKDSGITSVAQLGEEGKDLFLMCSFMVDAMTASCKERAQKWDELAEKIGKCYDDPASDLVRIGEISAHAFGYL